jgi:putative tricarboxylic transport membrane protein
MRSIFKFLTLGFVGAAFISAATSAFAEWPEKPITIIYPWPASDPTSVVMRTIGEMAAQELGQPVVINNVTGAGGTKALASAVGADNDGYTLASNWVAAQVGAKLFNPDLPYSNDDFIPIAGVFAFPFTLTVAIDHPANNVAEFVEWAKAEGRTLNYGVCAPQSVPRLVGEQFMTSAGVPYNPIPNGKGGCGGDNVTGLLNGSLDVSVSVVATRIAFKGQIKHLGLLTDERHPIDPELASAAEHGYPIGWGDNAFGWGGVVAPAGTPDDAVAKLQKAFGTVLTSDALAEELGGKIAMIKYISPEDSAVLWAESEKLLAPHVEKVLKSK